MPTSKVKDIHIFLTLHLIEQYIQTYLADWNGTLNRNGTLKETGCF